MINSENTLDAKCCFCGTIKGALIKLYQGWCCLSCFKELMEKIKNG